MNTSYASKNLRNSIRNTPFTRAPTASCGPHGCACQKGASAYSCEAYQGKGKLNWADLCVEVGLLTIRDCRHGQQWRCNHEVSPSGAGAVSSAKVGSPANNGNASPLTGTPAYVW